MTNLTLGLFNFYDYSSQTLYNSNEKSKGQTINLCLNRFKICQIDPTLATYVLDPETEHSKE